MNINIPQILAKGEGVSIEFKKAKNKLPESLFETICAFLNRNGGVDAGSIRLAGAGSIGYRR